MHKYGLILTLIVSACGPISECADVALPPDAGLSPVVGEWIDLQRGYSLSIYADGTYRDLLVDTCTSAAVGSWSFGSELSLSPIACESTRGCSCDRAIVSTRFDGQTLVIQRELGAFSLTRRD